MYFEYKLTWNDIYKSFFIKFFNNVTVKVFLAHVMDILYISLYSDTSANEDNSFWNHIR